MENKKLQFNNIEIPKKDIEIPKEEIQSVQDIFSFLEQISKEGYSDDSTYARARHNFTAAEIEEWKTEEFKKTLDSLSEDDALSLRRKIKRESEYEANQAEIDFINDQFEKLLQYIESKEIWEHKFSTNHAFALSQYHDYNFKGDASESEDYDKLNSYAGQGRDSIYYVSKSGLSLRLKKDLLMTKGLKAVLQKPQELIIFFNQREKQRRDLDVRQTFNDIEKINSIDFPAELVSFEPKLEFNVYEFSMFDFNKNIDADYKSNIQTEKTTDRIVIKNYDNEHMGHQINKIYF
jgi:hypothetical protein